jgi:hypothetical protein
LIHWPGLDRFVSAHQVVYLVTWINKPLSSRVVLVGSSPQKVGFLVYNWSVALAEARADSDRSRVYLPLPRVITRVI